MLGEWNARGFFFFRFFQLDNRNAHLMIWISLFCCALSSPIGHIIMKPWFIKLPSIFPISQRESFGSEEVRFVHVLTFVGLRLFQSNLSTSPTPQATRAYLMKF